MVTEYTSVFLACFQNSSSKAECRREIITNRLVKKGIPTVMIPSIIPIAKYSPHRSEQEQVFSDEEDIETDSMFRRLCVCEKDGEATSVLNNHPYITSLLS